MPDMQTYIRKTEQGKPLPNDPYKHGAYLLESDKDVIEDFYQLINKDVLLANISDNKLMALYQIDINLLMDMFGLALIDKDMVDVFSIRYYGWLGELAITRTKDGAERKLQATIGQTAYRPAEGMTGYGLNQPQPEQEGQRVNIIKKLFNRGGNQQGGT